MSISMFDTRVMIDALRQLTPATTFFRDRFFRTTKTFDTDTVDIDIVQGKRRVASYVSPLEEGTVVTRDGYKTNTYKVPYVKPKIATTAADILKRAANEMAYGTQTPLQRASQQMAYDLSNMDDMITRAEEIQCVQGLFNGQIVLRDAGDALVFPVKGTHLVTQTGTALWSNAASDPLAQLRGWKRLIQQDSSLNPSIAVLGSAVADAFLAHAKITGNTALLSSIKADLGQISPQVLPGGVTYLGYLRDPGIDLYTYDGWYRDAADVEQPLVPVNKVLLLSEEARFDRLYGAIMDNEAFYGMPRFPKSWVEQDPSVRWLMLQSAPLMVPHQVDAFVSAVVV